MQFCAVLFFVFRITSASDHTLQTSHAKVQAVERKVSNIRHEFESILLPRTPVNGHQTQQQDPISRTRAYSNANLEEFSESPLLKKQRTGARLRSENPPSDLASIPRRPFDGYESQTSAIGVKPPGIKVAPKQEGDTKAISSSQKTEKLNEEQIGRQKGGRTREQKDRRNALARQRRKKSNLAMAERDKSGPQEPKNNMSLEQKRAKETRPREQARIERDKRNVDKRKKHHENKPKNQEMLKSSDAEVGGTGANTLRREGHRKHKSRNPRANGAGKTSSTDRNSLSANSGRRYNLRTQRPSKVPETSSDSVSISSLSMDLRAHERLSDAGSELRTGPLGHAQPAGLDDGLLVAPPGHIPFVEPAPRENSMQQMLRQFQEDSI
ncbi:MAG: hypothetical protein GOMPHAMPRED_001486 [Gomphillus americanus]|uniref:Uncharacterized protein n=1 Tax=Gomphillus americanus TaxID=1940652 RepID=A0A8H3IEZ2_9LECA|nr:MAG: hypothetical protein GOMPHAMPRED_001486 [Gomphillus americanus]